MPLLPSSNTCCDPCENSNRVAIDLEDFLSGLLTNCLSSGIGSPEGVVAAAVGCIYTDVTDEQHPIQWKKTSGGTTSIGWVQELAL